MKRTGIILIAILLCGMAGAAYAQTWQDTLEKAGFDVVETFDNLDDWTGQRTGGMVWDLSTMPKKLDGTPSHWTYYHAENVQLLKPGEENIKFIANHGEYSLGEKSLCMTYDNFCNFNNACPWDYQRDDFYGLYRVSMFLGTPKDDTSGYSEIYVFYRTKFRFDEYSLTGSTWTWIKSSQGTDEYYLNTGTPGILNANTLIINGKRIPHGRTMLYNLLTTSAADLGNNTVRLDLTYLYRTDEVAIGDLVTIQGTDNYDGTYVIKNVTGNGRYIDIEHVYIPETFNKQTIGVVLGHLGNDSWKYGDNDNLGYYTIYSDEEVNILDIQEIVNVILG